MKKRFSYEYVKSVIESSGYRLNSASYKNAMSHLSTTCPNGHERITSFSNFKSDRGCKYCSKNAPIVYEHVKKEFQRRGYTLISKEYVSSNVKLDYVCPKGTEGSITWNSFKSGHGCSCCYGNIAPIIDDVKKSFEERGATLLTNTYINSKTKMDYICSNGHKQSTTWGAWKGGHGCPICAGNVTNNISDIRKEFEAAGYGLISDVYISNKHKLKYRCPIGHVHEISYGKFKHGRRCPTCAIINNTGHNNCNWQGGISFEPYCEAWKDKEYKKDIKDRDNNKCLNPYCDSKNPADLVIHHIDYNKKNCSPSNLITVCRSCNIKANKDREWHTTWYQAVINNRYSFSTGGNNG